MSTSITNKARALALLGQLALVFERSEVPLPPKKRSARRGPKPAESPSPHPAPLETARAHGRAVVQLGDRYIAASRGEGSTALDAFRLVLDAALDALRARPVVERRAFVDEVKRAYREAADLVLSIEGDGWRDGGQALLRRGTHAQIFTQELDRAFKSLDVPRRYVVESPLPDGVVVRDIAEGVAAPAPCPDGAGPTLPDAAIVADALAFIDADPTNRSPSSVRIYLRHGRRYTRVFWASARAAKDDLGSILFFVERESGRVFRAKSAKKVGPPMGRVIERCAPAPDALPSGAAPEVAEPAEQESEPAEVWERNRVVWFRSVDGGHRLSRVELCRGDTAWVSLGKRDGEPRGHWASVNGISRARRELKMGEQWIDLPLVYSREEAKERSFPPPPEGEPAAGSPFAALLEGLRTRTIRKLRVISTDATPHDMSVTRVISHPGGVVAEGTIKRSKARLTIQTEVDAKGRPTKYARLRRGSRDDRVEARRITSASAPSEQVSAPEPASAPKPPIELVPTVSEPEGVTPSGAKETAVVGLPKGTELRRAELFSSWGGKLALVDRPFQGGFDPNKMERTYTVRFAVDHRSKRPLNAVARYVGVEPHILNRRVPYEQTGFTIGGYGDRLEGTFAPLQRFLVNLKLRELTDAEHRELAQELVRREFFDATGYLFKKKQWQSLLGQSFTAIQVDEGAEVANEVDRFVTRNFDNDSLNDAAANHRWGEVARRGVFATTRKGRVRFIVHGVEPAATATIDEAPSEAPSILSERGETAHQQARRERAERKAAHLERLGEQQWESARAETATIPMGQPILVGHHSEGRHRNALKRQDRRSRQALDTLRAAESAHGAAERAGYAISNDDPDAIVALKVRLAELEASRELSKAINKAFRRGGWDAVEQVPDVMPGMLARAKELMKAAHWRKAPMDLTNLGANIRRVRKRIEEMEANAGRTATPPIEGEGFAITEHVDDNRIRFTFDERPDKPTITKMKRAGFRWSRRHGAWQRQLNSRGRYAAEEMAKELFGWEQQPIAAPEQAEEERQAAWQARIKAEHSLTLGLCESSEDEG